jgi:hypothetical protein
MKEAGEQIAPLLSCYPKRDPVAVWMPETLQISAKCLICLSLKGIDL